MTIHSNNDNINDIHTNDNTNDNSINDNINANNTNANNTTAVSHSLPMIFLQWRGIHSGQFGRKLSRNGIRVVYTTVKLKQLMNNYKQSSLYNYRT